MRSLLHIGSIAVQVLGVSHSLHGLVDRPGAVLHVPRFRQTCLAALRILPCQSGKQTERFCKEVQDSFELPLSLLSAQHVALRHVLFAVADNLEQCKTHS